MPRPRRSRKTGYDWTSFLGYVLGALVLLAMIPIVVLSQSHHIVNLYVNPSISRPPDILRPRSAESISESDATTTFSKARHDIRPPSVPHLFPLVQKIIMHDSRCCAALSSDVHIEISGTGAASPLLARAARRAEKTLRSLRDEALHVTLAATSVLVLIRVIHISVTNTDERLGVAPDAEYWLECGDQSGRCEIRSKSVYGAVNGLQSTLVQLFSDRGAGKFRSLSIHDWPRLKVRGLMVDTGRRFVPLHILKEQVLDGMALTRLNMLHLHLNDFCRFAVDLPGFPELRQQGIREGQYSIEEIQELVAYAQDRGIRVVPEIDIPGHADGLLPLKTRGLTFCESSKGTLDGTAKIFDDPEGRSRAVLRQLFRETAAAFSVDETWFHVGADEASPVGSCTAKNIATLEGFVTSEVIKNDLHRVPIGWEELLFKQSETLSKIAVGDTNAVIVAWTHPKPEDVTEHGHGVLLANSNRHYLDFDFKKHPIGNFWYDPSALQRDLPNVKDCMQPQWEEHRGTFLGTYADSAGPRSIEVARQDCIKAGSACAGVTCVREFGEAKCDTRRGAPFLQGSSIETSWVKLCPEEIQRLASGEHALMQKEQARRLHEGLLGGLSAMWTDRYCYIFQCGAAQEWFAKENGLMPMASRMFQRDLDSSFMLSFAGMVWPRAGVTAATLWNYNSSFSEEAILESAAWLASLLSKLGVKTCPAKCECDELMACREAYPVLKHGASDDVELLASCFSGPTDGKHVELGPPLLDSATFSYFSSLRLCFWKGRDCGGAICRVSSTTQRQECLLHAPGTGHFGVEMHVKHAKCDETF